MVTKWERKCKFCGDTFLSARSTAKFCPEKGCRQKWHRKRKKLVETPLTRALIAIARIAWVRGGIYSYEAAAALDEVGQLVVFYEFKSEKRRWRCQRCGRVVQMKLPEKAGCEARGDHEWHWLRKRS